MDQIKTSEHDNRQLSWADWMDELLRENFERKAQAWAKARPSPARITGLEPQQHHDGLHVPAPA